MRGYFEGWYFKQQNGAEFAAFIPAIHIDRRGSRSASIQVITDSSTYCANYSYNDFSADKRNLSIKIGSNSFSTSGVSLNIQAKDVSAAGMLAFGPLTPVRYDIMGPFRFIPFMECRHCVISMRHRVDGCIEINGKTFKFTNGAGYIESDRGKSFPNRYVWTQCCPNEDRSCSIMLSVADIPFLGSSFTGIICAIYWKGTEYRLATYCGAKLTHLCYGHVAIKQGKYSFEAELLDKNELLLHAPVSGCMARMIRENPSCRARYRFMENENVIFDFTSDQASFEYEYDQ